MKYDRNIEKKNLEKTNEKLVKFIRDFPKDKLSLTVIGNSIGDGFSMSDPGELLLNSKLVPGIPGAFLFEHFSQLLTVTDTTKNAVCGNIRRLHFFTHISGHLSGSCCLRVLRGSNRR